MVNQSVPPYNDSLVSIDIRIEYEQHGRITISQLISITLHYNVLTILFYKTYTEYAAFPSATVGEALL